MSTVRSGALAVSADTVWLDNGLVGIAAATNVASPAIRSDMATRVAAGDGSIWTTDYDAGLVRRFDTSGRPQAVIRLPSGSNPIGVAVTPLAVWVASHHAGTVLRIDPHTNRVIASIVVGSPGDGGPDDVGVGFGSVWVGIPSSTEVVRIGQSTDKVTARIRLKYMQPCGGFAFGRTAVWVSECLEGTHIARIDPRTNTVAAILDVGGRVAQLAGDGNTAWFVTGGDPSALDVPGYLLQLRADDTVAHRFALGTGFSPGGAAVAFGSVWVSSLSREVVLRVPRQ